MSEATVPPVVSPQKNVWARFVGVLVSPRATFEDVASRPHWLCMALLVIAVTAGCQMWFQATEVGRQATFDESVRRVEQLGIKLSDQQFTNMQQSMMHPTPVRTALSAAVMVVIPLVVWGLVAGVLYLVFAAFGGQAAFRQVFATVVHSSVVSALGTLVVTPLNYIRESMTSATNLSVFFPFLPEGGFLTRLLGMADLFLVWWVMVLAIGLAVLYRRRTRSVALSLFAVYGIIAIAIAAVLALRSTT